jgi:tetratricopeptide (TPR) repeat protein
MLPIALLAAFLAVSAGLERVLERWPADSLLAPLRRYEHLHRRSTQAAEASMMLGHLHLARAEYRLAADAYGRAAAGFDPLHKAEALYWAGIAWLGVPDARRARARLEQVERDVTPRRGDATLGIAIAWSLEGHPDRALKALTRLTARHPGEAGPAALERLAALADRMGGRDVARRARERLLRDYPRSFEAQGVGPEGEPPRAAPPSRSDP